LKDGSLGNYLHRAAHVGDSGLRDRIGCRRGAAASDNPAPAVAKPDQVCRKSIEPDSGLAGFRDASPTMPGGLRAGSARSRIGGATFAQECNAASPCARRHRRGLACRFLVAEHTGVLIVESTSRGSGSFRGRRPSSPPFSRPQLSAAALIEPVRTTNDAM
jgi:hypothetical protein